MRYKYINKFSTTDRDEYEYELRIEELGKMIKSTWQEHHLRQEEIGELAVLQKTEISKFKSKAKSARIETILEVFKALKAEINFTINSKTIFFKLEWQRRISNA